MGQLRFENKVDRDIIKRMLSDIRKMRRYVSYRNQNKFIRKNDRDVYNTYVRIISLVTRKDYDKITFKSGRMTNQEYHFILNQVVEDLEQVFKSNYA